MLTLLTHAHHLLASPGTTDDTPERSAAALALGLGGAAAFGLVLGSLHDAHFVLSSALKLPLVLVLPLAVVAPTLHWLHAAEGEPVPWSSLAARCATVIGRLGLFLFVPLPLVWMLWQGGPAHGDAVAVGALVFAWALAAAMYGVRLMPRSWGRRAIALPLLLAAFGQTAWLLRPWVGHPGDEFTWLLPPQGQFVHGVVDPMYLSRDPQGGP